MTSVPGVGAVSAAQILARLGDPARFQSLAGAARSAAWSPPWPPPGPGPPRAADQGRGRLPARGPVPRRRPRPPCRPAPGRPLLPAHGPRGKAPQLRALPHRPHAAEQDHRLLAGRGSPTRSATPTAPRCPPPRAAPSSPSATASPTSCAPPPHQPHLDGDEPATPGVASRSDASPPPAPRYDDQPNHLTPIKDSTAWSSPPACPAAKAAATAWNTTAPPRRHPEERQAEPPPDPGQGRALPADHEELAPRPAPPARHPHRAPDPARRLRRHLQHPAAAPLTARPRHPRSRLRRPAQGRPGDRAADTHDRVRTDRIDATGLVTLRHNGRLHHIGIGRPHAGTRVLLLVQDLHIRVINADTGELLRELTLDPDQDYQPTGKPPGWPKKTPRPLCGFAVSSMSCDITVVAGDGFEPT